MDTTLAWDELVAALRAEVQENGGLIRRLNQQTEALYRHDGAENQRLEDQIRAQIRVTIRCRQARELILRQTAANLALGEGRPPKRSWPGFPATCSRCWRRSGPKWSA
jgi:hypothetical protein